MALINHFRKNIFNLFGLSILLSIFLGSCARHNIEDIELICNFKVASKINYYSTFEHWNDFNGDGIKIITFNIISDDMSYFKQNGEKENFKIFNMLEKDCPFKDSVLAPYLSDGTGIYKSIFGKNEEKTVIIDLKNKVFLYYYDVF